MDSIVQSPDKAIRQNLPFEIRAWVAKAGEDDSSLIGKTAFIDIPEKENFRDGGYEDSATVAGDRRRRRQVIRVDRAGIVKTVHVCILQQTNPPRMRCLIAFVRIIAHLG